MAEVAAPAPPGTRVESALPGTRAESAPAGTRVVLAPCGMARRVPAPGGMVLLGAFGAADQPALTGPDGTVTHGELRARVDVAAAGYRPGERVPVSDPDPVRTVVAVLAADLAGATAVVVDHTWPAAKVREALRLARAGEVVAGEVRGGEVPGDEVLGGAAVGGEVLGGAAPFWIGFTSGSAGTPRPIGRAAGSWTASFPLVSEWTGIGPGVSVLVPGPLASSLFLFGTLHALWAGAHVTVTGRWDPARLPAVDAVHCVPAMLADLTAAPCPPRLAVCGGAAIPDAVRLAARDRGIRVLDYYGATELSFVAWRRSDGRLMPFPGVEIDVRGGEIWARSPYLSLGYAAPVTGPLRHDADGFATVGDLGTLSADGALTIRGRGDGTILTGGSPVLPEDVESAVRAAPGVRDVVVVGTPHPRLGAVVTAVLEPAGAEPVSLAALRAATRSRLAAPQRPRLWYVVPRLPRTSAGKIARKAVTTGLADGTLAASQLR